MELHSRLWLAGPNVKIGIASWDREWSQYSTVPTEKSGAFAYISRKLKKSYRSRLYCFFTPEFA